MLASTMSALQTAMRDEIDETDSLSTADLSTIGGLDIQWQEQDGFGALVVLSWPSMSLLHQQTLACTTQVP